jgi:hypothetical protein
MEQAAGPGMRKKPDEALPPGDKNKDRADQAEKKGVARNVYKKPYRTQHVFPFPGLKFQIRKAKNK